MRYGNLYAGEQERDLVGRGIEKSIGRVNMGLN